jgi:hypothetical protein
MFKPGDFPALSSSLPVTEIAPPVYSRPGEVHRARLTTPLVGVALRLGPRQPAPPSSSEIPISIARTITIRAARGGSVTVPFNPQKEALISENRAANLGDAVKRPFTGNSL